MVCIVLHCITYIVLYYFVAALITGSSNVSRANFSPRKTKVNVLNPKRTPRHQKLEEENLFISTAHWHIAAKMPSSGSCCLHPQWGFFIFSVLICPTWIIIHSLLAAVTLSKMTDVESSVPDLRLSLSLSLTHTSHKYIHKTQIYIHQYTHAL